MKGTTSFYFLNTQSYEWKRRQKLTQVQQCETNLKVISFVIFCWNDKTICPSFILIFCKHWTCFCNNCFRTSRIRKNIDISTKHKQTLTNPEVRLRTSQTLHKHNTKDWNKITLIQFHTQTETEHKHIAQVQITFVWFVQGREEK